MYIHLYNANVIKSSFIIHELGYITCWRGFDSAASQVVGCNLLNR